MLKATLAILALSAAVCTQTASAQTPVAHVYVQTTKGINLYDAAADGRLTLLNGSPFKVSGQSIGISGSHLISIDTDVHSYTVSSSGAVEGQVSSIDTQSYNGKQCGGMQWAFFDRAAQDVYVILSGTQNDDLGTLCVAIQSFKIASSGALSYLGTIIPYDSSNNPDEPAYYPPAFAGNDIYGYGVVIGLPGVCGTRIVAYQRESSGALELAGTQSVTMPKAETSGWAYMPYYVSADSSNHLAIFIQPEGGTSCQDHGSPQLGSFTINSNGSIASTNTYGDMPSVAPSSGMGIDLGPISTSSTILPVGLGNDLQLFHFNGAKPITPMTGQIPVKGLMTTLQWDSSGHLYGLNRNTGILRVYTITSSGLSEDPGSPVSISGATGMFVQAK